VPNAPRKLLGLLVAAAVGAGLLALPACSQVGNGAFPVIAEFDRAPGLYPGGAVRLLGIDIGHITDVVNDGDVVRVEMDLEEGTEVPADAHAVIIPLTLLGERYVQLAPVYEGGDRLEPGDTIPMERTRLPAEVDDLLRGLDEYLGSIDPQNAGELVTNLAEIVDGQGAELNELIQNAHATIDLLSDKGDELGHIVDALAGLTGTLAMRTESIEELITSYAEVSGVLADNAEDVDAFVVQLDRAAVAMAGLLEDNQDLIDQDVDVITTVTRTLQRNIDSLERTLTATPQLFAAAQRAYDPERNLLPLNNQADLDTTSALYLSRIRDRLAGICRRLVANFAFAGNVVLEACGDITSGFFEGVLVDSLEDARSPDATTPQAEDLLPEGVNPPVAPPTVPDVGTLVGGALQLLAELLDPAQLAALGELTPALLEAISNLTPEQLVALLQAAPEDLAELRDIADEELPFALERLLQETIDPADLLDQPLLPEEDEGNVSDLVDRLLGGGR
jgi:phospholipid/cholesterol/gamma-HCH transport system substrate-binding protein